MKKISLLILVFLSSVNLIYSQYKRGYIIGNESDTTWGYINFEGSIRNSDHCNFISMPDSTLHKYSPGDIKAFRFVDSKYFSTEEIKIGDVTKKVFLEWLIKGRASILTYTPENTRIRYFIIPENQPMRELVNSLDKIERNGDTYERYKKEYVGDLKYFFKDCPEISKEIETTPFNSKPLIKIAKEYHERTCETADCIVFEDTGRKLKFEIGGSVSYMFSQLRLNNENPEKFYLTHSPGIGIEMRLSNLPLISPKFSFSTQMVYYNLLYSYDSASYIITDKRMYRAGILRVPLQMNYKFTHKKLTPFIAAGITLNVRLKETEYEHDLVNLATRHFDYMGSLATIQPGANASLGLEYFASEKVAFRFKVEYENAVKFFGYFKDFSNNHNFFVQTSFLFHLN
jgi:hypothetical protein